MCGITAQNIQWSKK